MWYVLCMHVELEADNELSKNQNALIKTALNMARTTTVSYLGSWKLAEGLDAVGLCAKVHRQMRLSPAPCPVAVSSLP